MRKKEAGGDHSSGGGTQAARERKAGKGCLRAVREGGKMSHIGETFRKDQKYRTCKVGREDYGGGDEEKEGGGGYTESSPWSRGWRGMGSGGGEGNVDGGSNYPLYDPHHRRGGEITS